MIASTSLKEALVAYYATRSDPDVLSKKVPVKNKMAEGGPTS
jgi:hypothetical protein